MTTSPEKEKLIDGHTTAEWEALEKTRMKVSRLKNNIAKLQTKQAKLERQILKFFQEKK